MTRGKPLAPYLKSVCECPLNQHGVLVAVYEPVMDNTERISWQIQHLLRS